MMAGLLEALSWLSILLGSMWVLIGFFLVFGGWKWMDGED
ncbi:unnamed protein product [marine sediment metagenome]|uniref:Uncharacterized protein n=1 Tax=marine sediment metagenome TaxID=412755 RepID=X1SQM4_9ZZZZ